MKYSDEEIYSAFETEEEEAERETRENEAKCLARREAKLAAMDKDTRYNEKNRALKRHKQAMRRAGKAAPDWLSDKQLAEIKAFYEIAYQMEKLTGVRHEVDHIEQLKGKCPRTGIRKVCGLHVPWNLRVITRFMNMRRGDNHYPCWPLSDDDDDDDDDDIAKMFRFEL